MKIATVITTVSFRERGLFLLGRTLAFICQCYDCNVKLSIGLQRTNLFLDSLIMLIGKILKYVSVETIKSTSFYIQNSKLRNIAYKNVDTESLILSDVDLIFDKQIIECGIKEVRSAGFSMFPCVYLSKKTRGIVGSNRFRKINNIFYSKQKQKIKHIAIPSSFFICRSKDFATIHGFDENYQGHGYEDFDFLLRFFESKSLIDICNISSCDSTYRNALYVTGFRGELAKLCFKNLLNKKVVFHLWHPRNKSYIEERNANRQYFYKKFDTAGLNLKKGLEYPILDLVEKNNNKESQELKDILNYYAK